MRTPHCDQSPTRPGRRAATSRTWPIRAWRARFRPVVVSCTDADAGVSAELPVSSGADDRDWADQVDGASLRGNYAELFHLREDVDDAQVSAIRPPAKRKMKISL
jgi:hypothetical protein